jgi:hypothetical protein
MKRFLAVLLIGLFCFALVAGCGKKEEPAMEQTTPADTMTAPATDTTMMQDTTMMDTSATK